MRLKSDACDDPRIHESHLLDVAVLPEMMDAVFIRPSARYLGLFRLTMVVELQLSFDALLDAFQALNTGTAIHGENGYNDAEARRQDLIICGCRRTLERPTFLMLSNNSSLSHTRLPEPADPLQAGITPGNLSAPVATVFSLGARAFSEFNALKSSRACYPRYRLLFSRITGTPLSRPTRTLVEKLSKTQSSEAIRCCDLL
ncbi:hypothetical protein BU15DRAFT_64717 [Melanogaster broomeanus]|nr:hypothetical protein BU15DRAFT_64717 [Melanogaster broomeanus]